MRRRFKEQKSRQQGDMASSDGEQQDAPKASDSIETIKTRTVLSSNNQDTKQTLHFDDGASYVGTLDENGNFSGHGIYTFPDGTKFDGLWIDGQRNGAGTQIWTDGTKYVGNWKNGQRSGTGTITWPNGCRYDGRWKNDNICQGHYYYGDGHHYEGSFNSDWEREGYGTYYWKDGSYHRGSWKKGNRHGQGQYFDRDNVLIREGDWINDEYQEPRKPISHSSSPGNWNDATTKAINLLFQLEKCNYSERRDSLSLIESLSVPARYEAAWNQILRIWSTFAKDLCLNTKTLPNPDRVRYSQRPFPITGSSGVQEVIKEIIKYA